MISKKIRLSVIFIFTFFILPAQEVVLDKNVDKQYKQETGPNMRHFFHIYIGGGVITDFDEVEGAAIRSWRSGEFIVGYRYKLKLLSFYALGADISFRSNDFFMEGDDTNPYDPDNPLALFTGEKKQVFTTNGAGLEIYQRINFGKRGNTVGKYIDAGIRGQVNFANVQDIVVIYDDPVYTGKQRIYNRRLQYVERFQYGISGRLGINHLCIYGIYRLSDLFREDFQIPELPRLTIGLQYAFY